MTKEEHIKRHAELHGCLDELVADFIAYRGKGLSESSIIDLIQWSFQQTINPSEDAHSDEVVDA